MQAAEPWLGVTIWNKFDEFSENFQTVGVERDFVFYQEFLIPGAAVGILECTHFFELFGYNYTM